MDILQNVNITATAYIQAHCIRKPNSRTFWQRSKDFQGPCLFSRSSQSGKNSRTFNDRQEPCKGAM